MNHKKKFESDYLFLPTTWSDQLIFEYMDGEVKLIKEIICQDEIGPWDWDDLTLLVQRAAQCAYILMDRYPDTSGIDLRVWFDLKS